MKKTLITLIKCYFIILCSNILLAQENQDHFNYELEKAVLLPNSPEATEFTKYGNTAVNLYSGTTDISVPLYTIQGKELDIPITLTYDASGIKVEQEATWVGLGWNLNIGGRISRIVNGLTDDPIEGGFLTINQSSIREKINYYKQRLNQKKFNSIDEAHDYLEFMYDINRNAIDAQPDFYSLYAPGINEYFIPNITECYKDEYHATNNPRIKINKTNNNGEISWEVIGEDGTTYFFEKSEKMRYFNDVSPNNSSFNVIVSYENSWLLTKIISANRKDIYTFEYYNFGDWYRDHIDYNSRLEKIRKFPNASPYITFSGTSAITKFDTKQILSHIIHNGHIVLRANIGERYDVGVDRKDSRLSQLQIMSPNGGIITQFKFNNSDYFNLDGLPPQSKNFRDIRLKLNSVDQLSKSGAVFKTHTFNYLLPDDVPSRTSYAKDYFGYYNGRDQNTSQLEAYTFNGHHFSGANRKPSLNGHATHGILQSIVYPTKGSTRFKYEPHDRFITERIIRNVNIANLEVNGNTMSTITYGCDDAYIGYDPIITSQTFNLREETTLTIHHFNERNNSEIYIIKGTANSYCDIVGIPDKIIWHNRNGLHQNIVKLFPEGTYSIVILLAKNPDRSYGVANCSLTAKENIITRENRKVGGIRISEITDYDANQNIAKKRLFEYKNDDGESTGIQNHIPHLTDHETYSNYHGEVITLITRKASFSSPNTPMVTYKSVKEITIDSTNNTNGYVHNEFYTGLKGVVPNTNKFYGNNLISNLTPGQIKTKTYFDDLNKKGVRDSFDFAQHSGLLINGLSTSTNDGYLFSCYQYAYVIYEFNKGTSDYFVLLDTGITGRKISPSCPCTQSPTQNTCLFAPPSYDFKFSPRYTGLTMGITTSGTLYGGVSKAIRENYFYDEEEESKVTTSQETIYNSNIDYLPQTSITTHSNGNKTISNYYYPKNSSSLFSEKLITQNKLSTLLSKVTKVVDNDRILSQSTQTIVYKDWGNNILLPSKVQTLKSLPTGEVSQNFLEDRIVYHDYDTHGNPLEVSQANGTNITYLWGYNQQYPIAKIENATLSEVASAIGLSITTIKTNGITDLSVIDHIRENLPNAMVTTYTYDPLIGVTSITDPRGYSMYYQYYNFNRLEFVKDAEGNILSKNDYHYKE